jgi:hypothetical protein
MNFGRYLKNLPKLHSWDGGKTWTTGGFNESHLRALYELGCNLGEQLTILESGAGNSTLMFCFLKPKQVISIAPDAELFSRIAAEMKRFDLPMASVRMIVDHSEWALPTLAKEQEKPFVDLCLIDGEHNYPNVFVDFFYMNYMMKNGAIVLVDDIQIYYCRQLAEFLEHERDFELVIDLGKLKGFRRNSNRRVLKGHKLGLNALISNS